MMMMILLMTLVALQKSPHTKMRCRNGLSAAFSLFLFLTVPQLHTVFIFSILDCCCFLFFIVSQSPRFQCVLCTVFFNYSFTFSFHANSQCDVRFMKFCVFCHFVKYTARQFLIVRFSFFHSFVGVYVCLCASKYECFLVFLPNIRVLIGTVLDIRNIYGMCVRVHV